MVFGTAPNFCREPLPGNNFSWEVIALLLPSRRKPTDADSRRAHENSVPLLSIQADVASVAVLARDKTPGGESAPEPPSAATSAHRYSEAISVADFEKASAQGSSAVR